MALGPGLYDDLCTKVREEAQARGAILIIIGGNKGQGFSCQASLEVTLKLPEILRTVAAQIEASYSEFTPGTNPN